VPWETDADGNPLPDVFTNPAAIDPINATSGNGFPQNHFLRILCRSVGTNDFDGCPSHLPVVNGMKYSAFDVAAWADLWFHSNPIFIEVRGSTVVAGVK
jgi:hypothetical protein